MATGHLKQYRSADGWSFDYLISGSPEFPDADQGVCLMNVSHQGHFFAQDIRLCQIWVNPGDPDEKRLTLGTADFDLVSVNEFPALKQRPPKPFNAYPVVNSLSANYVSKGAIYPGSMRLKIVQHFVFTDYSKDPAHEPGGVLTAARVFPMFHFSFVNGPDPMSSSAMFRSLRFDLRLGLKLDLSLNSPTPRVALMQLLGRIPKHSEYEELFKRPQQLGLFKDEDELDRSTLGIISAILFLAKRKHEEGTIGKHVDETASIMASIATFQNVEKPAVLEMIGRGLRRGDWRSEPKAEKVLWDNVHWWGGFDWRERKATDPSIIGPAHSQLPSTPGGTHAAHFHWRWGLVLQKGTLEAAKSGEPQFKGTPIGGPLIDPAIPDQDIRFAAVQGDIASMEQTTSEFGKDLRIVRDGSQRAKDAAARPGQPLLISQGNDTVLYASCEVHQQQGKVFQGTVFPQGIFFAHEPEQPTYISLNPFSSKKSNLVGSSTALYWTRSLQQIMKESHWSR